MNASAFTSFYRALARHRLYAAFNIGGLALGIAVFLVLGLYVRFQTSYEKWLPDHDKVYVVQTVWTIPESPASGPYPWTMGGLIDQMRQDFPGVVGARINGGDKAGTILAGGRATKVDAAQVDANFFKVVPLPLVAGDQATALSQPGNAAIDETTARAYFGDRDPIGQTLVLSMDKVRTYRVTAVFRDLPKDTDFKMSVVVPLTREMANEHWDHWGSASLRTLLRFETPAAARAFEGKLTAFVDRRGREMAEPGEKPSSVQHLALLPLTDLHLEPEGSDGGSAKLTVVTLGMVGVLTLLIAVVNYINLATARAGLRAREVAMRKVLGADRGTLIRQFLGEAVLTVGISALCGLILAELGLPLVNAAGGLSLTIPYGTVVPALALLAVVVGALAGAYPAIMLARFPAATVLASARSPGGGRVGTRVRELLVVAQFGLAIAFMIGTAVLVAQTRHVRSTDLGFQRESLLVLPSLADSAVPADRKNTILTAIRALPQVKEATVANAAVGGSGETNNTNVPLPGVAGPGPSVTWIMVSPRFFETYGARLLAGRWFDDVHGGDDTTGRKATDGANIVINRWALPTLRFKTPQEAVGKTLGGDRPRTIIGVVDDLRFDTPRNPVAPSYYVYTRKPETVSTSVATIRVAGDPRTAIEAVTDLWQRMAPQVPLELKTADQRLANFYEADDRATRLFAIGAGLAVLIGCVGLWGLASFNTARRTKEIGIRKTLGASSTDIVRLLVGQFLRPVLIANLVAWPLAYFAMRTWLAGFSDAISLSPLYFIGASALAIVIAVLTVLGQSLRASRAAPAWALRHD